VAPGRHGVRSRPAVAVSLATELWRILRPTERVEKVAGAIDKAAPVLLEAAKAAVPNAVNEQQAVEQIKANPQLQAQFRVQALSRWEDIEPIMRYESEEREKAREFVDKMTGDGPEWRQVGTAFVVGLLSLMIVGGGGMLFWRMMDSPQLDPGQKGLILGALIAAFGQAIGFWFGSSAQSRAKDATISEQAKR